MFEAGSTIWAMTKPPVRGVAQMVGTVIGNNHGFCPGLIIGPKVYKSRADGTTNWPHHCREASLQKGDIGHCTMAATTIRGWMVETQLAATWAAMISSSRRRLMHAKYMHELFSLLSHILIYLHLI
jgi:hypothetical protein